MTTIEELILEKKRYGLPEEVTEHEQEQLNRGVPIQYIIGFINFEDINFKVNSDVLIPRYETQEVVNRALEFISSDSKVLDLGTGSGYIGLTIKQKKNAEVTLSDISSKALMVAKQNAKDNSLEVNFVESDLFENIDGKFDVIVSNPPYIPETNELHESVTGFEPHNALFAGKDGNDIYKRIISEVSNYLNDNGTIVFEISPDNVDYIKSQGFTIENDINKKPRIAFKTL